MRLPSGLKTYLHSLLGIAIAMLVIFFTLNFIHNRGGTIGNAAGNLGNALNGTRYNF